VDVEEGGFRLQRVEIFNWGTFDSRVWVLWLNGKNTLVTGDIGSGKSTLVDAITTLLVPPAKITYNRAAGAEARERTLRSYVLGYFKAERAEGSSGTRPVALRTHNSYSVILAHFRHAVLNQDVTVAQVFWATDLAGQPTRLYVVADRELSISGELSGFGSDIRELRKRLRTTSKVDVWDNTFTPYGEALRRRLGIANPQALELFYQTVSMKSVGDLTEFVRQHMLEPFPVEERIVGLIGHFDNLNRAHEAVLKAKDQIGRLEPLVADCTRHALVRGDAEMYRSSRAQLPAFFASLKKTALETRVGELEVRRDAVTVEIRSLEDKQRHQSLARDDVKKALSENGGDRIEQLKRQIETLSLEKDARWKRFEDYSALAREVDLPVPKTPETFSNNRQIIEVSISDTDERSAEAQNALTDKSVDFRQLRKEHEALSTEIASLRERKTKIPTDLLKIRWMLCHETKIEEAELPFAGELIQVRETELDWEGTIERVVGRFGRALLVANESYGAVAEWVDRTGLGGQFVYFRVREQRPAGSPAPGALARKLAIKPDSKHYAWLETELARRFDHICCDSLDQFRRERKAVTRAGQVKGSDDRHEKNDRFSIHDRSRDVLGWSNEAKIAALEKQARNLEARIGEVAQQVAILTQQQRELQERIGYLKQLAVFKAYEDLDWQTVVIAIKSAQDECQSLEASSDLLRALMRRLEELEAEGKVIEKALTDKNREVGQIDHEVQQARSQIVRCETLLATSSTAQQAAYFARLDEMRPTALGTEVMLAELAEIHEKKFREWLDVRIDQADNEATALRDRIITAMTEYRLRFPADTREVDASLEAAPSYSQMLEQLQADALPAFEKDFKRLLNENTIREVVNFQSHLNRERQLIRERVDTINESLQKIDYNPGRYIELLADTSIDQEIRDFQIELRACTENTLTGSDEDGYSEAKFLQVKTIIDRMRGRETSAEADRRWTRKVTDVREWFTFSASERWREDGREHEHYTDSGGKSGGQKEKLAYTILAASLAYQFGLDSASARSRSFRFVVIDEAFGRGSDESTRYALELFGRLGLQLLVVTPLQKIHTIEPYVAAVGFVHSDEGRNSMLRNLTIEQYREERAARFK
jgi:uncharacterized protein YPO0396